MKVESRKVDAGRRPTDTGFLVHIGSSAASNLVIPVFSLFLPLLALQLGANVLEIGLVGGAGNIVYSFMPFVMGRFANTSGARRFFIVSSLALLSVVSFL
jgi:MFS family permease